MSPQSWVGALCQLTQATEVNNDTGMNTDPEVNTDIEGCVIAVYSLCRQLQVGLVQLLFVQSLSQARDLGTYAQSPEAVQVCAT